MEEIQAAINLEQKMIDMAHVHEQEFEPAGKQTVPPPEPVDPQAIAKRLARDAVKGISIFKLAQRRDAKRAALSRLDAEVEAETRRRADQAAELQRQLDEQWSRLEGNDPQTVLQTLEQAFEDNEAPAAAVSCEGPRVDVVMRWPQIDSIVPDRKPDTTPTGRPTLKKRKKTERAELYLECLSSHALVTAKEAFAVCPSIQEVGIAVVRIGQDPARGDQILEPVVLAVLTRSDLDGIQWGAINATAALLGTAAEGRIGFRGKGANKTLFGLDLSDEPEERAFIGQVAEGLGSRVPEDGVAGLPLPIRVVLG